MGSGWLLDTTVDFGESPCGCPWGANTVHNMGAAQRAMRKATLVVAVGTSLSILANYFDPWVHSSPPPAPRKPNPNPTQPAAALAGLQDPDSKWAAMFDEDGQPLEGRDGAVGDTSSKFAKRAKTKRKGGRGCKLAIINQVPTHHYTQAAHPPSSQHESAAKGD